MTEQYVLQQLKSTTGLGIYYYTNDRNSCEIDFLLDDGEKVIPLEVKAEEKKPLDLNKPYEEMSIEELQQVILNKLSSNGPLTDQMKKDVAENVYRDSLLNWARSF